MADTCRSCRAPIAWATTSNGKAMPVNVTTDPAGNVAVHRDQAGKIHARVLKAGDEIAPWERRTTSHFSDCPKANEHRRKTGARR